MAIQADDSGCTFLHSAPVCSQLRLLDYRLNVHHFDTGVGGNLFTRNALLFSVLSVALAGCGSKTVSPALAGLPGIVTDIGADGYPIVKSITFQRPAANPSRILECMHVEVDGLISVPIEIDGAARASGHFYVSIPINNYVAFTLSVRGGEYRFEHLATAWIKGPLNELKASAYNAPEKSYQALQSIADRVSACAGGE